MAIRHLFFLSILLILFHIVSITASAQACAGQKELFKSTTCNGDELTTEEAGLLELVNAYRKSNGRPAVASSIVLSKVANRHLLDLKFNLKSLTHSWSDCAYDIKVEKTWTCVQDASARLGQKFDGKTYETLYFTANGRVNIADALDAWKRSPLHNSIILNLDAFDGVDYSEVGIAIDGRYAALWFGSPNSSNGMSGGHPRGLGLSLADAIKGFEKTIPVKKLGSTVDSEHWQGISADKKLRIDLYGKADNLSEADLKAAAKLEVDGSVGAKSLASLSKLLENLLPDWKERNDWLTESLSAVKSERSASRTKVVLNMSIRISADNSNIYLSATSAKPMVKRAIEL